MANPQLENGYTKVANEIFEALCGIRIPGETRQVIDVVIRKTYGYNKKEDCISLSQFCLLTKMRRGDVCRAINKAVSMNILKVISKEANGKGNKYCVVKDFDSWKSLAKKRRGVANKLMSISKKANKGVAKKLHTKERVKETNTKEREAETSSADIPKIIKLFDGINPNYEEWYGNTTQRKAISVLLERIGFEKLERLVKALPSITSQKTAPRITTPYELKRDWAKLGVFISQQKSTKKEILI